jgi:hypothetical protein
LFAIYNAMLLTLGIPPETIALKESDLRPHLASCLQDGQLGNFPVTTDSVTRSPAALLQLDVQHYLGQRQQKDTRKKIRYMVQLHVTV